MTLTGAPIPLSDRIARPPRRERFPRGGDPLEGMLTKPWSEYFTDLVDTVNKKPERQNTLSLTVQAASLGATDIASGSLNAGLFRVTTYARITQAASVSSSLTVNLAWTESGVALAFSGTALTANTTATVGTESWLIRVDEVTPVSISTTYASAGGTPMQYRLDVVLEKVAA